VEFLPGAEIGMIEYAGLIRALSDLLGRKMASSANQHCRQLSANLFEAARCYMRGQELYRRDIRDAADATARFIAAVDEASFRGAEMAASAAAQKQPIRQ
jgi:hypothetical protein